MTTKSTSRRVKKASTSGHLNNVEGRSQADVESRRHERFATTRGQTKTLSLCDQGGRGPWTGRPGLSNLCLSGWCLVVCGCFVCVVLSWLFVEQLRRADLACLKKMTGQTGQASLVNLSETCPLGPISWQRLRTVRAQVLSEAGSQQAGFGGVDGGYE